MKHLNIICNLCLVLLILHIPEVNAQNAGTLDSSFNGNGTFIPFVGNIEDRAFAVDVQIDGKIVSCGTSSSGSSLDIAVLRINGNGELDTTFSQDGIALLDVFGGRDVARDLKVLSDNSIVIVGETENSNNSSIIVAKYLSNGTLDSSFANMGIQITDLSIFQEVAFACDVDSLDRIVVGGTGGVGTDFILCRYTADGQLDTTFNNTGIVVTNAGGGDVIFDLTVLPNGKILVCGSNTLGANSNFALAQYLPNGLPDSTFGTFGLVSTDLGSTIESYRSILIDDSNRIIAGGSADFTGIGSNHDFILSRYTSTGNLDLAFGINGTTTTAISGGRDIIYSIVEQEDGRIIAAGAASENGSSGNIGLARYNVNGSIDTTFGLLGVVQTNIANNVDLSFDMTIQPDNKIIVAGQSHQFGQWNMAFARYYTGVNVGISVPKNVLNHVLVYPNPIQENINIIFNLSKYSNVSISLYDLNGRMVIDIPRSSRMPPGKHFQKLTKLKSIKPGPYILVLQADNFQKSIKLIKE